MRRCALTLITVIALLFTSGCEDTRPPAQQASSWFPAEHREDARCIIWYESTNNPAATGGAGEAGLFQIHPVHARAFTRLTGKPWSAAWDPRLNGQFALKLWREQGWRPWSTARRCGLT